MLIQLVQAGCLSLFLSFMSCSALKKMSELRQEAASIHKYTRPTAAGGGGEPVEIMGENLWVENMLLDSHRLKGWSPFFSNIIFFCFNSNILYTPLSHHKLWNVGIETLEKHTILEKQALPYPQGRLHYRLVVRLVLPAGSILRLNTELVPVTTKGLPERKGEEVRSWKVLIHLMTWWGR